MKVLTVISALFIGLSFGFVSESQAKEAQDGWSVQKIGEIEVHTKEPMNSNLRTLKVDEFEPGRINSSLIAGQQAITFEIDRDPGEIKYSRNGRTVSVGSHSIESLRFLYEVGTQIKEGCRATIQLQIKPLKVLQISRECD